MLKNYISKDDVAVYCLFLFFIFSGKIFQLSIIEETHQMTSQGNYKLNGVLSNDILESGLPLFVQVLQIFNYLFFLLRNQPVTSTLKNQKVIMIIEQWMNSRTSTWRLPVTAIAPKSLTTFFFYTKG